jgi:transglutaminase-like putative cysteine protease
MKYIVYVMTFLLSVCGVHAQGQDLWEPLKAKYSEEPAVFVERSEEMTFQVNGDSLEVFTDVFEDVLHLKNQSNEFVSRKVYGSHFTNIGQLKAKTLVWDKNRYRETDVSTFKRHTDPARGIFYDDSYYYSFEYPNVTARCRTQLQYRSDHRDPRFISGFIFGSYLPQAKTSFRIKTTREVELVFRVVNDPGNTVRFNKIEKGKNITYEWSTESLPSLKVEERSPGIRYYTPHLILYVKSFQGKSKKVNVLSSVDDLYHWYSEFVKNLNSEPSDELTRVVAELKSKSKSEIDIVKNVFYWVQENIQYIAFEDGMRGFIPHNGSYVCEKRYGDCKDMANLIVSMLSLAGVKAHHTWIGTRELPYKYSDIPTPLVDDHMIATYISAEGDYYFLDATSDYTPFGLPSSMIQGKEALISKGPDAYEVRTVPVIEKERNIMTDTIFVKLQNDQLIGSGTCSLTGYPKVFGGYELDRAAIEDVKDYVTKLTSKGNNKYYLDDYSIANLENRGKPTSISYKFRISDYFQKAGDELYINLNLNKDFYNAAINRENRKTPIEMDYGYTKLEFLQFEIPDGYEVDYLPENSDHKGKLLGCKISYQVDKRKISVTKQVYVDYLLLEPAQFELWNESVRQLSSAYKESIILRKK